MQMSARGSAALPADSPMALDTPAALEDSSPMHDAAPAQESSPMEPDTPAARRGGSPMQVAAAAGSPTAPGGHPPSPLALGAGGGSAALCVMGEGAEARRQPPRSARTPSGTAGSPPHLAAVSATRPVGGGFSIFVKEWRSSGSYATEANGSAAELMYLASQTYKHLPGDVKAQYECRFAEMLCAWRRCHAKRPAAPATRPVAGGLKKPVGGGFTLFLKDRELHGGGPSSSRPRLFQARPGDLQGAVRGPGTPGVQTRGEKPGALWACAAPSTS